ncbi:MAG TPA: hypothetical protein VL096_08145 [Pirellulaceae bacterium]|nr:hypothetical protein [Pirellulaceae bacterium]
MSTVYGQTSPALLVAIAKSKSLGDDCLLGSEPRFDLSNGAISGSFGKLYGTLHDDTWQTSLGSCREILFKADVFLVLGNSQGGDREIGPFPYLTLNGHALWLPSLDIAAWYVSADHRWVDAHGNSWDRASVKMFHHSMPTK